MLLKMKLIPLFFFFTFFMLSISIETPLIGAESEKLGEIHQLVETLEDNKKRDLLIKDLKTLINTQDNTQQKKDNEADIGTVFFPNLMLLQQQLTNINEALLDYKKGYFFLKKAFLNPKNKSLFLEFTLYFLGLFLFGFIIEKIIAYLLSPALKKIEQKKYRSLGNKIFLIISRAFIEALPIFAFAISVISLSSFLNFKDILLETFYTFTYAYLSANLIMILYRVIFVPKVASLRILPLNTPLAYYFYIWARRITLAFFYGWFVSHTLFVITRSPLIENLILKSVGFIIAILLISLTLNNKKNVTKWLQKSPTKSYLSKLKSSLSSVWYIPPIIYISYVYIAYLKDDFSAIDDILKKTFFTIAIFIGYRISLTLTNKFLTSFTSHERKIFYKHPPLKQRMESYKKIAQSVFAFILFIATSIFILEIWNIHVFALTMTPIGQSFIKSITIILVVILCAFIIWEITQNWIDYTLKEKTHENDARVRTLLPLLRNIIFISLSVFVTLMVLSEIGVNIAPLIAGAGVLGLAVGIGSQALVKDLITGFFILIENTVAVGDVVTTSSHTGVVEKMTIRTLHLRDMAGSVHVIPFSEVTTFINMTHQFSYAVIEIGIAYKEDVENVMNELNILGQEILNHPDYKDEILEPIEVLGLDQFADSAVIIKARIKTKALKQWHVRRGFQLMMKKRFDEKNIEIPFPHLTIYAGSNTPGETPPFKIDKIDKKTK